MPQSRNTWDSITFLLQRNLPTAKCQTAQFHNSFFFFGYERDFPSLVLSCLGYVYYLFHLLKTKIHSKHLHKGAFIHSTLTINKLSPGCYSLSATPGNVTTTGPHFPLQFQSLCLTPLVFYSLRSYSHHIFFLSK